MSWSTKFHFPFAAALAAAALVCALASSGCQSMSDPEGSDLPWAQRSGWEDAPNIPQSLLRN